MKFIADLHIHSKYSRATSPKMDLENLNKWAKIKGIDVLGTGDFTHPEWFKSLKNKLEPASDGLYFLKGKKDVRFLLTSEISCIYSKKGKVRKVHILIFAPGLTVVEKINNRLAKIGNLKADGRPILGLDAKELAKIVLDISEEALIIPAHLWTPWFGILGSKSGFNSIEECFEDYSKYIFAGETGLSSDPAMNWRLSNLDKITLISNSDAHSPEKIGREVNVFQTDVSYSAIREAIAKKDKEKFLYTIEFFPEEGKYHYDGHRSCGIAFSPEETRKHKGICPVCRKPLTIGVMNRVEELADRPVGFRPKQAIPFKSLIPLKEVIAYVLGVGPQTKRVEREYNKLISNFKNEFNILLEVSYDNLKNNISPEIAEAIIKARQGEVKVIPGYDGVFGKIVIPFKKSQETKQEALF